MEQSDNRIDRLRDGVLEAIRMAENEQWHHEPLGTVERDHYDSLVRTLKAYDDQAKKYQTGIDTRETHAIHLLVEHGIDPRVSSARRIVQLRASERGDSGLALPDGGIHSVEDDPDGIPT